MQLIVLSICGLVLCIIAFALALICAPLRNMTHVRTEMKGVVVYAEGGYVRSAQGARDKQILCQRNAFGMLSMLLKITQRRS